MPKNEEFWNPYRLVPQRPRIDRRSPVTDETFTGLSGFFTCTLENLTPLLIGDNGKSHKHFLKKGAETGRKPILPGSSLKGMLRSLAEIVGGGCFIIQRDKNNQHKYDSAYNACENSRRLCIACRMFGMMERGKNATVHRGKIGFGDGEMEDEKPQSQAIKVYLSNCGTRHVPFYTSPVSGDFDGKGRKLYFHHPNCKDKDTVPPVPPNIAKDPDKITTIHALLPGHRFRFTIQFSNLEQEELELLAYCLALEPEVEVSIGSDELKLKGPLRHKIGYAKPLGLGSCAISIEELVYLDEPRKRFASLRHAGQGGITGVPLQEEIQRLTFRLAKDESPTMEHLRKMLVWDESDRRVFKYPTYSWFKASENFGIELKRI